jgi:predicted dehydrogenase
MNQLIRWGIWGTGAIAHRVAEDLGLVDGAILHAVASRSGERAASFATAHAAQRSYQGLEALLQDPEVDVVYVATPNHRHWEDCLACIHRGKAVICEKPFALNLAQARLVADASRANRVFCMEAMWTRFIPAVRETKRMVASGAVGAVRMIQGTFGYPAPRSGDSRLFDSHAGGGALLDRGVYLISLAQDLLGVPEKIRGTAAIGATGVDEQSFFHLCFANGAVASLGSSFLVKSSNEFVIYGERGSVRVCDPFWGAHRLEVQSYATPQAGNGGSAQGGTKDDGAVQRLRSHPAVKSMRRRLSPIVDMLRRGRVRTFPFAGNGYQFELMEVNRCLRAGLTESPVMSLNDSLEVLKTMDALRAQWGLMYPQEYAELQIQ